MSVLAGSIAVVTMVVVMRTITLSMRRAVTEARLWLNGSIVLVLIALQ